MEPGAEKEIPASDRFVAAPVCGCKSCGPPQWRVVDAQTGQEVPSRFFSREGAESFAARMNRMARKGGEEA